ncbi:uncharacterized protein LOC100571912 [Acyrthosiphon pisum]|uniref:DUF4485 domain-containing protein n=1 Tax=Acyrthosiphon pisum TaxID=7029 RepID=A0A8R1W6T3_ACYPI|nr:uncharacterized protein LOC100571912 [Acyrthosiphon pisum]|eukprot:XP_003246973.1 PREDICTED: uncharacterized protein LOC100571912 [Acyrthosiphon pisum]
MYNDMDFEVAANDISEQVVVIRDPELAMTIEKWVLKLTAENRGANELKYLQLLQYMMARGRINGPFVRDPPPGPLVPLSRYINPPPCSGHGRGSGGVECWQTSNCSRAVQTTCDDVDGDYEDEDFEEQVDNEANNDETTANDDVVEDLHSNGGELQSPRLEDIGQDDGVQAKRDGHLAGGGGGECRGAPSKKNPFTKLCDPCLDNFGRHLLKKQPGPLEAAYRDLLGDCALPVLTEAEQKTVCPELLQILENVDDTTTLQDFYFQVALCTCDQGALMMKLSDAMVDDFRTFVSDVFESRTEHISDGLAKEQMALCEKYAYLYDRTLNRATLAMDFLREAMPVFSWHKYQADPDEYLKRTIMRRAAVVAASSGDAAAAADGDGRPATRAPASLTDDEIAEAAGREDDDDAQQSVIKKLLYRINWLRTEVGRVDCEGQRLYEQHSELTVSLADLNRRLSDDQCRSAGDIDRHKNELTVLRQRSADQTAIIDRLMETIQLTMQEKQPSSAGC